MTDFDKSFFNSVSIGFRINEIASSDGTKLIAILIVCCSLLFSRVSFAEDNASYPFSEHLAIPASKLVTSFVSQLIGDPDYAPGPYIDQLYRERFQAAINETFGQTLHSDENGCLVQTVTSDAYRRIADFDVAVSSSDFLSRDPSAPDSPVQEAQQFFYDHQDDPDFQDAILEHRLIENAEIYTNTLTRFKEDVCEAGNDDLCTLMASFDHEAWRNYQADLSVLRMVYGLTILHEAARKQLYADIHEIASCEAVNKFDENLSELIYEMARTQAVRLANALREK
jgi:hypothetical protein